MLTLKAYIFAKEGRKELNNHFKMIRIIELCEVDQGFKSSGASLFEIWATPFFDLPILAKNQNLYY